MLPVTFTFLSLPNTLILAPFLSIPLSPFSFALPSEKERGRPARTEPGRLRHLGPQSAADRNVCATLGRQGDRQEWLSRNIHLRDAYGGQVERTECEMVIFERRYSAGRCLP